MPGSRGIKRMLLCIEVTGLGGVAELTASGSIVGVGLFVALFGFLITISGLSMDEPA
jgi:hypothetical protein